MALELHPLEARQLWLNRSIANVSVPGTRAVWDACGVQPDGPAAQLIPGHARATLAQAHACPWGLKGSLDAAPAQAPVSLNSSPSPMPISFSDLASENARDQTSVRKIATDAIARWLASADDARLHWQAVRLRKDVYPYLGSSILGLGQ